MYLVSNRELHTQLIQVLSIRNENISTEPLMRL